MMKENITAYKLLLVASAVVSVGFTLGMILTGKDRGETIIFVLTDVLLLAIGAIVLFFPKISVNYRLRRVNGRWRYTKVHVPPSIFSGAIILISIIATGIAALAVES